MQIGLILIGMGLILFFFAYFRYKQEQKSLAQIKLEDLVSYYLDLAYNLLPIPFWSAIIGIVLALLGIIVIFLNIQ
ncbi:MAG: hypothetical protein ABFC94_16090 [Syntrophomonas sp.]